MSCNNKMILRTRNKALLAALCLLVSSATLTNAQDTVRPEGWTETSHGNRVPANYDLVLPDDRINELFVTFTPESWAAEEEDMIEIYGERGTGGETAFGGRGGPGRGPRPDIAQLAAQLDRSEEAVKTAFARFPDFPAVAESLEMEIDDLFAALGLPAGFRPPIGADGAGFPPGRPEHAAEGGNLQLAERNPTWAPVTIQFGGQAWWEVGFRYKGNSTLSMGWGSGSTALPFKLDFDEFEDDYPEVDNQRFHGFKQLSFANNDLDASLQREKVTADIFRAAGVPAAETAFYAVYVDTGAGEGFKYWGIYTAIELPDDTLIETQFSDDDGNMYKPDGAGSAFAADSFTEQAFDKETNRDSSFDDVLAVFAALHADTRLGDPVAWRSGLESVFDVDGFLLWLATNTLLQNWDTYGNLAHNYYLYADESTGQLVWIPWDNNMALQSTLVLRPTLNLAMDEVDPEAWPLIGYLLDDEVYATRYVELVSQVSANVFTPQRMEAIYEATYALLAEHVGEVEGDEAVAALRAATDDLVAHVNGRANVAAAFLADSTE